MGEDERGCAVKEIISASAGSSQRCSEEEAGVEGWGRGKTG